MCIFKNLEKKIEKTSGNPVMIYVWNTIYQFKKRFFVVLLYNI